MDIYKLVVIRIVILEIKTAMTLDECKKVETDGKDRNALLETLSGKEFTKVIGYK